MASCPWALAKLSPEERKNLVQFRGEAFCLESPTEAGLRANQESLAAQQQREAEAQRQADEKAQADRERESFTLTGSNRPADVQAAQGQGGLFDTRFSRDGQGGKIRGFEPVKIASQTARWLGFDKLDLHADFAALAKRHSEYYGSDEDVRRDVAYVLEKPENWFPHADGRVTLVRASDGGGGIPSVRIDFRKEADGSYRITSVYVLGKRQLAHKMAEKRAMLESLGLGGQSPGRLTVAEFINRSSAPGTVRNVPPSETGKLSVAGRVDRGKVPGVGMSRTGQSHEDGSEPASAVAGKQPAFAGRSESQSGQTTPNARGQGDASIAAPSSSNDTETPPKLSRGRSAGMPLRDVQAVVDRVSKRMKNLPRVHVLESPASLSTKDPTQKALRDSIRAQDAWNDVEGAHHDGEIYLFASNLANEAKAEHVLATHELTHYGLRGAVGKDLDSALQAVWLTNPAVREAARAVKERTGIKSNVEAVEEVLADMPTADLVKLKGWRKVVQAVRNWPARIGATGMARRLTKLMMSGLDQQSQADVMVADLVTAARDWVRNGKQPDSLATGTMFSFAGQNALTADRFALASAQDRLARGEDAETVRQETGWHRGRDKGWRFEISDHDASLYGSGNFGDRLMGGDTLGDVLDHPRLFAAYPQLRDVKVETLPADSKSLGRFSVADNTIRIRENLSSDQALSAILHELQHAIQRREQFATGTNLLDAGSRDAYFRAAGEVEARNTQARQDMTEAERRFFSPQFTASVKDRDVIVSWNGKEMASEPANAGEPSAAEFARTEQAYGGRKAWEQAKASGQTKLGYRQWVQARTPAFKAWFGDWELAALDKSLRRVRGSDQAKAVRQEIVGKPLTNIETGMVATVSGMSFGKMLSKTNVDLSVSPQAHYQALGNLDMLFRLATRTEVRAGKKPGDAGRVSGVHHFAVPMPFDGETLMVKILAKEFTDQQQGNRLYLVQAVEIETPASERGESDSSEEGRSPHPPAGVTDRLAQMVAAVKGEGVSKVTDPAAGEPLVSPHTGDIGFSRAGQFAGNRRRFGAAIHPRAAGHVRPHRPHHQTPQHQGAHRGPVAGRRQEARPGPGGPVRTDQGHHIQGLHAGQAFERISRRLRGAAEPRQAVAAGWGL